MISGRSVPSSFLVKTRRLIGKISRETYAIVALGWHSRGGFRENMTRPTARFVVGQAIFKPIQFWAID